MVFKMADNLTHVNLAQLLAILRQLADRPSMADLVATTGLSIATVKRLLRTLRDCGVVAEWDRVSNTYRVSEWGIFRRDLFTAL